MIADKYLCRQFHISNINLTYLSSFETEIGPTDLDVVK